MALEALNVPGRKRPLRTGRENVEVTAGVRQVERVSECRQALPADETPADGEILMARPRFAETPHV
jgi:hypothetical protein